MQSVFSYRLPTEQKMVVFHQKDVHHIVLAEMNDQKLNVNDKK